jgi:signal transduction histidine kinase
MTSDRPGNHEPGPAAREILEIAEARVRRRISELFPVLAPGGSARAEGYLRTLSAKIGQVIDGSDPVPIRDWLSGSPLYEPLMEALGHELIQGIDEAAAATLTALRAWHSVRGSTASRREPREAESEDLRARMKGPDAFELLVEVAHDFRSPLTSILFLAEALRDGHSGPLTDLQRSQLGLIYSAAFGLASIASDIMDHARQEEDLIAPESEAFSVAEVFHSVERMVRPIVEEKRLELRVVVPERWQLRGHPHALSRVLLNLTTNALKFTDEGSVELGVRPLPLGRIEYYVQDTGRGISSEQQRTLFQPFRRRYGRSDVHGSYFSGSGMGLSIARRLLRAMGADLTLDRSDGSGTRFSFVLTSAAPR